MEKYYSKTMQVDDEVALVILNTVFTSLAQHL